MTRKMKREKFLQEIDGINVWQCGDRRAPHKPLLLLLAFGRLVRGKERLAYFKELQQPLKNLLRQFGPLQQAHGQGPVYPFWRLQNDNGLWEIPNSKTVQHVKGRVPAVRELIDKEIKGGFSEPVWNLLHDSMEQVDLGLVQEAARQLLCKYFPELLHNDIRRATELFSCGEEWVAPDVNFDPQFCEAVLCAYQRRCAVCEFDIRLNDDLFGLEAAHIKWPSEGGPYKVANGLALCPVHHRALYRGALGLESISGDQRKRQILVSEQVNGLSVAAVELRKLNHRPLYCPEDPSLVPACEYIDWHRKSVFRGNAIA